MQWHLDQLREQERETLKFVTKEGEETSKWISMKHNEKYTKPKRKALRKVSLLPPEASSISGSSTVIRLEATGRIERTLCTSSLLHKAVSP